MNLQNVLRNGEEHKDKPDWSILIFCFPESEQRCRTFNCNKFYLWERGIWKVNKHEWFKKVLEIFQASVPSYFSVPFSIASYFFHQNILNWVLNPKQLQPACNINWKYRENMIMMVWQPLYFGELGKREMPKNGGWLQRDEPWKLYWRKQYYLLD